MKTIHAKHDEVPFVALIARDVKRPDIITDLAALFYSDDLGASMQRLHPPATEQLSWNYQIADSLLPLI